MSLGREILRKEAKKLYKEQTKNVPKKQRVPFPQFFKNYRDLKMGKVNEELPVDVGTTQEDFNIEDMVNINEISDGSVEVVESTEEEE